MFSTDGELKNTNATYELKSQHDKAFWLQVSQNTAVKTAPIANWLHRKHLCSFRMEFLIKQANRPLEPLLAHQSSLPQADSLVHVPGDCPPTAPVGHCSGPSEEYRQARSEECCVCQCLYQVGVIHLHSPCQSATISGIQWVRGEFP